MTGSDPSELTLDQFKGRSYAELDELFARRIPARKFRATKTQQQLDEEERNVVGEVVVVGV